MLIQNIWNWWERASICSGVANTHCAADKHVVLVRELKCIIRYSSAICYGVAITDGDVCNCSVTDGASKLYTLNLRTLKKLFLKGAHQRNVIFRISCLFVIE